MSTLFCFDYNLIVMFGMRIGSKTKAKKGVVFRANQPPLGKDFSSIEASYEATHLHIGFGHLDSAMYLVIYFLFSFFLFFFFFPLTKIFHEEKKRKFCKKRVNLSIHPLKIL